MRTGKGTATNRKGLEEGSKKYELSKLAQRANKRLLDLERAGMTKYAYSIAEKYFEDQGRKSNRFKDAVKRLSDEEVEEELKAVNRFLNSSTSTPARIREVEAKKEAGSRKTLEELWKKHHPNEKFTDGEYRRLLKFFSNDKVKDKLFSQFASSEQAVEEIFKNKSITGRNRIYSILQDAELTEGNKRLKILTGSKRDADFLESFFKKKIFAKDDFSQVVYVKG